MVIQYNTTKIFKVTNPEGKVLIIHTTKNVERLKYYLNALSKSGKQNKLVESLVTYTVANHTIQLLEEFNGDNKELLNNRLKELYEQYDSINNGLNEKLPYNGLTKRQWIRNYNKNYQKTNKYKEYKRNYFNNKKQEKNNNNV